ARAARRHQPCEGAVMSKTLELRERRRELVDQMRSVIDAADDAGRDLTGEELAEIEKREQDIREIDREIRVREAIARAGDEPALTVDTEQRVMPTGAERAAAGGDIEEQRTHAFLDYLRTGEARAQLLDPNTDGGYTVPRGFLNQLIEYRDEFGIKIG